MSKAILYGGVFLGIGILAFIAYRFMQTPSQVYSTTSANPNSNGNMTTDPYQTYPFVANVAPRVDNSNQPWANNNRAAINGVSTPQIDVNLSNTQMLASILGSGSSIINSGQSIWEDVSGWFSSGDSDWLTSDVSYNTDWSWA